MTEEISRQLHDLHFCFCHRSKRSESTYGSGLCFAIKIYNSLEQKDWDNCWNIQFWKKIILRPPSRKYGEKELIKKAKDFYKLFTRNPDIQFLLRQKFEFANPESATEEASQMSCTTPESNQTQESNIGNKLPPVQSKSHPSCPTESPKPSPSTSSKPSPIKSQHLTPIQSDEGEEYDSWGNATTEESQRSNENDSQQFNQSESLQNHTSQSNIQPIVQNQSDVRSSVNTEYVQSPENVNINYSTDSSNYEIAFKKKVLDNRVKAVNATKNFMINDSSSDESGVQNTNCRQMSQRKRQESTREPAQMSQDIPMNIGSETDESSAQTQSKRKSSTCKNSSSRRRSHSNPNVTSGSDSDSSSSSISSSNSSSSSTSSYLSSETSNKKFTKGEMEQERNNKNKNSSCFHNSTKKAILGIESTKLKNPKYLNFKLTIPAVEWQKIWKYESPFGFVQKLPYSDTINEELRNTRPSLIFSALKGKKVVQSPTGDPKIYINLNGHCAFQNSIDKCPVTIILHCHTIPVPGYPVIFEVQVSGPCVHVGDEFFSRRISGARRQQLIDQMGTKAPKDLNQEQTNSANSEEILYNIRPIGVGVARQLKFQKRQQGKLEKDPKIDLLARKDQMIKDIPAQPFPGFIQKISESPFQFTLYSSMQILAFKDLAKKRTFLELHIDATGSIFSSDTDKKDGKSSTIYLYSVVTKGAAESSILPVYEFVSAGHSFDDIRSMMISCNLQVSDVLRKYQVKGQPVKRITTDFSYAIIKSSISTYNNNMSLGDYLESVEKFVHNNISTQILVIVTLCRSHFVKAASILLKSKKIPSKTRQVALHCLVNLANSDTYEEFCLIFTKLVQLFETRHKTNYIENLKNEMCGKEKINMEEIEEFRESYYSRLEEEVEGHTETKKGTRNRKKVLLRDFTSYVSHLQDLRCKVNDPDLIDPQEQDPEPNPFYTTAVVDAFSKVYFPVIPLWARFCHVKFDATFTSASNGIVEKYMSNVKKSIESKSICRLHPGEFAKIHFSNIQFWLRHSLVSEIRVKKTRKRKPKEPISSGSSSEEETKPKSNVKDIHKLDNTDVETWKVKRRKTKYGRQSGLEKLSSKAQAKSVQTLKLPSDAVVSISDPIISTISHKCLTGDIIVMAQNLIFENHPNVAGLLDPARFSTYASAPVFNPNEKTIQILFDKERGHWTLATSNCGFESSFPTVVIMDSYFNNLSLEMKRILVSSFKHFVIDVANSVQSCQGQSNLPEYQESKFRQHLLNCLSKKQITTFPGKPKVRPRTIHRCKNCVQVSDVTFPPVCLTSADPILLDETGADIVDIEKTVNLDHDYVQSYPTTSASAPDHEKIVDNDDSNHMDEYEPPPESYYMEQDRIRDDYMKWFDLPPEKRLCKVCEETTYGLSNCSSCKSFTCGLCYVEQDPGNPYSLLMCTKCYFHELEPEPNPGQSSTTID